MTTDQHDQHDDSSIPSPADPWSGHQAEHDFWGDHGDWIAPAHAEADDTTRGMRRPRGFLGAVGAWADRTLSSGVEPTRSHRMVRTTIADDAPAPFSIPLENDDRSHHDDRHDDGPYRRRHDTDANADAAWPDERWDDGWDVAPVAETRSGVDPLLARLGGVAVVLTLLVPFLLGMRSDDDDTQLRDAGVVSADVESNGPDSAIPSVDAGATSSDASSEDTDAQPATAPAPGNDPADPSDPADLSDPAESGGTAPVAQSSALGAETATPVTTAQAITEPAQADDPADRLEPACAVEYEVVAGDFWLRLAEASGVDLDDLLAENGASPDTPLYAGRSICLPSGARTPAPPTTAAPSTAPVTTAPSTAAPTTAAPSTPPSTAAPRPAAPGDVEQIIRDVWPDDLEERALEIAWRESNYVSTAKNFCCYGLFQIYWEVHQGWLADLGVTTAEQLYDPTTNARAALTLYQRAGGWGPWGY